MRGQRLASLPLDEQHRRRVLVVFLRDSEGLSFNTIGQRFGISMMAARKIYYDTKGQKDKPQEAAL
jgi:hypothetical protein